MISKATKNLTLQFTSDCREGLRTPSSTFLPQPVEEGLPANLLLEYSPTMPRLFASFSTPYVFFLEHLSILIVEHWPYCIPSHCWFQLIPQRTAQRVPLTHILSFFPSPQAIGNFQGTSMEVPACQPQALHFNPCLVERTGSQQGRMCSWQQTNAWGSHGPQATAVHQGPVLTGAALLSHSQKQPPLQDASCYEPGKYKELRWHRWIIFARLPLVQYISDACLPQGLVPNPLKRRRYSPDFHREQQKFMGHLGNCES